MSKSLANDILATFVGFELPPEITCRFNILELLSQNELGETFLLSDKESGRWFVLKSFQHSAPISSESELLKGLDYKGLPAFEPEIIWNETLYTLREYVEGVSLSEYLDEHMILDEPQALHILMTLCDIVGFIHSRMTPIIHRDIKPSNIIINLEDNSVTLIDFGIARRYNENSSKDTTVFATLEFAPPEQFGFAQTDARTDIYALGVLLRYMLTGETGHNAVISDKHLEKIAQKCTALDPKERYQSVDALKKAFNRYKASTLGSALRIAGLVLFLLLSVGGFLLHQQSLNPSLLERELRYFVSTPAVRESRPLGPRGTNPGIHEFHEPLIEAAVRIMLDLDEYEPITYGALEAISEINIHGMFPKRCYWDNNEYAYQTGNIETLEDLRYMPNLQLLYLSLQPFYDLSPIANNLELNIIHLYRTNVSDISPLVGLPHLHHLRIWSSLVTDWSELKNIRNLYALHLNGDNVDMSSILDFGDISFLSYIDFNGVHTLASLDGIQNIYGLKTLHVAGTGIRDFSLLNDRNLLPHLEYLYLSSYMRPYLYTLTRRDIDVILYP